MGQYYMPIIIKANKISTFYSHDYGNGLKLMEHSYVGNDFVNAVLTAIRGNRARIAWIGDYSDSPYEDAYSTKLPFEKFERYYNDTWGKYRDKYNVNLTSESVMTMNSGGWLINHSQKIYINMAEYIALNKFHVEYNWYNQETHKTEYRSYDMCVNPLPLLTACGNGRGNGDYSDYQPDYDKVGTWAFDVIEYAEELPLVYNANRPPKTYKDITLDYRFKKE